MSLSPVSDRPVRFALVGCGVIAATHARALASLPPEDAALTVFCDIETAAAESLASEFGGRVATLEDALEDPEIDALSICTPSGMHSSQTVAGLGAGKHVIVEKPMDVSVSACDAMVEAQRKSGCTLAVVSQHRFDTASEQIRQLLDDGALGRLVYAEARVPWYRTQEYYDSAGWRGTWALDGGGCLMNQGIHTIDLFRWYCGPVKSVYARMATSAHERIEVEDIVAATVVFQNGVIATVMASTATYPGFPARVAVHGTEGSAILEGDRLHSLAIRGQETIGGKGSTAHALQVATGGTKAATAEVCQSTASTETESKWGDAHRAQLADFIRCCRTGDKPRVDGVEGRNAVELILAIYESARSGAVVSL